MWICKYLPLGSTGGMVVDAQPPKAAIVTERNKVLKVILMLELIDVGLFPSLGELSLRGGLADISYSTGGVGFNEGNLKGLLALQIEL